MSAFSSGSLSRCLGYFAAATFVAASASQNALHGWEVGLRSSQITATILAAASIAGAIMAPIALAATFHAFRNWQIVRGALAAVLAASCFSYAVLSSLGFVSGANDVAAATRGADADAYALAKAKATAATAELATLAALPTGNKKTEADRSQRRAKLEADREAAERVMSGGAKATNADPTAATLAAYAKALGMAVEPDKLAPWLNLLAVVFFELGAAASLIVVGTLAPAPRQSAVVLARQNEAAPAIEAPKPEPETLETPAEKQRGRKRAKPLEAVVGRIRDAGGKLEGSLDEIGAHLGVSKSSAHRALNTLAAAGLLTVAASPAGTLVTLR